MVCRYRYISLVIHARQSCVFILTLSNFLHKKRIITAHMSWSSWTFYPIKWPRNKETNRTGFLSGSEWLQCSYWTCLLEPVDFPDGCVSHTQHADVKHSTWHVRLAWPHITAMKYCNSPGLQFNEYFMLDQVWNPACISENRYSSAMNCLNPLRFTMLTLATPQRTVIISCVARVANATNHSLGIQL